MAAIYHILTNLVFSGVHLVFELFQDIWHSNKLAWLPLQSLAVKKKLFFVQILGGEKLLKFVEKCQ